VSVRDKIGVFDSGVGGLSVALAIQKNLPGYEVVFKDDSEHVPYGTKELEEIYQFTRPIMDSLASEDCKVILIERLREEIQIPLIGMEPAVKPAAANTKTGIITVCATPRTLGSDRYKWLKDEFAQDIKVLEPDCSEWSYMIENNSVDREKIAMTVKESIAKGSDQIVLGCTHYHWIENEIKQLAQGRAEVIQPERPVIEQLKRVLRQLA
jgi:glutamate racemase